MKTKKMYVVTVERSVGIDKYYRKTEEKAISLYRANQDLFPDAKIQLTEEEVK